MVQGLALFVATVLPVTDPNFDPPASPGGVDPGFLDPGVVGPGTRAPEPKVLFINFDGVRLEFCGPQNDDPRNNCSTIFQGTVAPYHGDAADRAAVMQAVRNDLVPYDVTITDQRPPDDVDYDMEMVGQWEPVVGGGFLGVAPRIDCFDEFGPELSFTLDPPSSTPAGIAKVILQEVAHTWGLEHVASQGDLLYPTTGGVEDPAFEDACHRIVRLNGGGIAENNARCPEQHAEFCDDPNEQNSHAELLSLFGPAQPDAEPPTLLVHSPADGAEVPHDFHLVVEILDDRGPQIFPTEIEFEGLFADETDFAGPGVFPIALTGIDDGTWPVTVRTRDEAGNEAVVSMTFVVGTGHNPDPTSSESGDDSGGGDESGATGDDGGCTCRSGAPWSSWFALALLGVRRRRLLRLPA